ncbi:MAG: YcnI family protein [Massilia sp.]
MNIHRLIATTFAAPMLLAFFCAFNSAQAHVSLDQKTASAGSYQKLTFRVGHGCEGSASTAITVLLPEGFNGAKAMPKPGWTIATSAAGKPAGAREISWKGGPLPDEQFDEFNLLVKLPDAPGKQVLKVIQQCEKGRAEWTELPGVAGKYPAPVLEIVPAGAVPAAPGAAAMPDHAGMSHH